MAEDNRNDKNDNIKVDNKNDADKTTKESANAQAQKPKQQRRTKKTAVQSKSIVVTSKRKEAIARAYIKKGTGKITINKVNVDALKSKVQKAFIFEPIEISTAAANYAKNMDIKINVKGGGISAQMQAARSAVAKGIISFSNDESLKKTYLDYDRSFLVDDPRRVEPKKFKGPKARARFQTSYR